ncbi:MAG: TIGR03087 family PEP-CTERM/XrtA system glycosyltransferase [Candidatus Solibacter sp.]
MRILYLCHRIPYPPDKGDKIRAFHQIRALAVRHEIDLFTLADDPADLEHSAALREYCREVTVVKLNARWARIRSLPYLLTSTALTIPYFDSAELQQRVNQALGERSYDRIFVYCSAMAQYVEHVANIPMVIDLVDVDSNKWTQYAAFTKFPFSAIYYREGKTLAAYERRVCEQSAAVVVTTEREARLLGQISPKAQVHVIPNGVDTAFFSHAAVPPKASGNTIGFTGDMAYFPNQEAVIHFARNVLPLVREVLPDAGFLIVGRSPSPEVQALSGIPAVEVTGFVPDVRAHLARMKVSVAPFSIAAGIQNKILEAMSYELPVVATSRATQGLTPAAASAVETADSPREMAAAIVRLLRNPEMAREKGRQSRIMVAGEYNWSQSLDQLTQLLENPTRKEARQAALPPCS